MTTLDDVLFQVRVCTLLAAYGIACHRHSRRLVSSSLVFARMVDFLRGCYKMVCLLTLTTGANMQHGVLEVDQ